MYEPVETSELLVDDAFAQIKERIMSRKYAPGEKLTVRRLCEDFGTSETPIKQALNRLVTLGLVESMPRKGMRVREFQFQDLKDMFEARMMIELFCRDAVIARLRRDEEFAVALRTLLDDSNMAIESYIRFRDTESFAVNNEKDNAFHHALVQCCENRQIINSYEQFNTHIAMFVGIEGHTPQRMVTVQQEHEAIAESALLCDRDAMKRNIEKHVFGTIQLFRDALNV